MTAVERAQQEMQRAYEDFVLLRASHDRLLEAAKHAYAQIADLQEELARLRASHDRLLEAAKEYIRVDPQHSLEARGRLRAAITAAKEQTP